MKFFKLQTKTLNQFNKRGVPYRKMMLKIPFTGTVQYLKYPENNDLYDPVVMPPKVEYIPFSKVCRSIQTKDWTLRKKFRRIIGPYAFRKNQWMSYNDIEDISVLVCCYSALSVILFKLTFNFRHGWWKKIKWLVSI